MKKGLGRGFDSLIPSELLDESFDPTAHQDEQVSDLRQIKLSQICPDPDQPRRQFDEGALQELAVSIKEHGVVQPIVVTPHKGNYMIVAGERRYRAALIAGIDKIPALVRTLSDQHKLELSLIENIQRRNLNILETATAYLKLRDQFNLNADDISARVGRSKSSVVNIMRLLRLPDNVKQAIVEGSIREGQARPLVGLDSKIIDDILPTLIKEEWSARKVEQFIVQLKKDRKEVTESIKKKQVAIAPYVTETKRMEKRLNAAVQVKTNSKGAGQIIIKFTTEEDFKRLNGLLG